MQNISALKPSKAQPVDWEALLNGIFRGKTAIECSMDRKVFWQGQPADSLFYLSAFTSVISRNACTGGCARRRATCSSAPRVVTSTCASPRPKPTRRLVSRFARQLG